MCEEGGGGEGVQVRPSGPQHMLRNTQGSRKGAAGVPSVSGTSPVAGMAVARVDHQERIGHELCFLRLSPVPRSAH